MFWPVLIGIVTGSAITCAVGWWFIRKLEKLRFRAERRARTAERLAEIGKMTGGLAHEIRNPLSTIGMNAQLLGEGLEELPEDFEPRGRLIRRLAVLRREVERLGGILSDFLSYAGELRLDRRRADLNAVISELADFFMPQAQQQRVRLRADLAAHELPVDVDVGHIKQAVLNLMLNAVQAMTQPPASDSAPKELILKTERDESGRESCARLHVIDTGPGVPAETLARIFDPYFTTKAGGTGLGLPTTRRLVEAHGGTIDVRTEPGRGTDFILSLPLAINSLDAATPAALPAAAAPAS
ncbi:MAG: two-component sensor histidine kinase [Phycisphaerales bacterium]|nr:two-component sensor histidine kinase [Phycisphaerales bacterium]